jgi:raffinose/stachyose/melibiose transport system permease protein
MRKLPRISTASVFFILAAYGVFTLFPILMALLNSLKTDGALLTSILALPEKIEWGNYVRAYKKTAYLSSLFNTVLIAAVGLSGIVLFGSLAGYKLSRTSGKLSALIFALFVLSMLIPFHSIMITLNRVSRLLHVQGSRIGLGLIYIGLGVPLAVFLFHGFVKSIPRELEEAAIIDGCGDFGVFFRVVFPLLRPIIATVVILNTLWIWNDFLLPLLMLTDSDTYTLLLSTNMLFGEYNNNEWSAILAALIMAMLPVVVLYLLLQKHIVNGISDGALKG